MFSDKLGLVSVSFRDKSPKEILSAMKSAGLSYIEWGSDVHAPKEDIVKLNQILKLQKDYGIECCSYGTYFRLGQTPIEELIDYIKAAKILGTNILRLWCGDKNSQEYTEEEKTFLFNECRKASEIAKETDVTLCMECHNGTYTNKKESALELMKAVNSNHFQMYWQPNQFKTEEENLAYANLLSPFTKVIHVFNWKERKKFPLCEAENIWKDYISNFAGEKTLLLEFMPDDKLESLTNEAKALKEIAE